MPKVTTRHLFGIVNKNQHKIFIRFVRKKDAATLIPIIIITSIITQKVPFGSTIHNDGANVYRQLSRNYNHKFVEHERFYIDPNTGVHSYHIENVWANLKMKLKSLCGSQNSILDGHIDEYTYRYNRKEEGVN